MEEQYNTSGLKTFRAGLSNPRFRGAVMKVLTPAGTAQHPYNWRLLVVLVVTILFSVILVTPYSLALQADKLKSIKLPLPLAVLLPLQWAANTVLLGGIAALGLLIAPRIGLGLPFVESWLAGKPDWAHLRRFVVPAAITGAVLSCAILAMDRWYFEPRLRVEMSRLGIQTPHLQAPAWTGFLASFYGGTTEEILMRLFFLSLLAWLGARVWRTAEGRPTLAVLWMANILAAILFGLGHLPATVAIGLPMDPLVIGRAVVLNGIGGVAFGWFYWTYGLEAAILSHFSADIVLHVVWPALAGS